MLISRELLFLVSLFLEKSSVQFIILLLLLVSRILKLQFEFMEALITGQGQMKADEFMINGEI